MSENALFLRSYGSIVYAYDMNSKLIKKTGNRTHQMYYDGDKLIVQKIGDKIIRYFYDLEGVAGFKVGTNDRYTFGKDAQGNVISLYDDKNVIAWYSYDAWGRCKVCDADGNEIVAWDDPAILNPFRWKGQYYDTDTELYYIGGRWYDPERGRYISSASPEMLLENVNTVFALNLYAFTTSNPVNAILDCGSINPSLDFYYNGEYKTWWEKNKNWVLLGVGIAATIAAVIAAPFTCGASTALVAIGTTLGKIALGTVIGAAISLAVGGAIARIKSAKTGHGFWEGFADSVTENAVDALVTSFAFTAVTIAAGNIAKCFQCFKEGTLVETEDGLKPIEEVQAGDYVLAYNEETGEQEYKEVVRLFRNETTEWYNITVNGETLSCTGGHPFYVPALDKFILARELEVGEKLLLSDGSCGIIEAIEVEKLDKPETTYNFEVADFHTYYVGVNRVLCHNMCRNPDLDFQEGKTLEKHYNEHGIAMGYDSPEAYLQGARDFLDGPKTPMTESFVSAQGTYFQYNLVTNEFGIINSYGGISTYFKPSEGLTYWLTQIAKFKP